MLGQMASQNMQMVVRAWLAYELTGSYAALGTIALANAIDLAGADNGRRVGKERAGEGERGEQRQPPTARRVPAGQSNSVGRDSRLRHVRLIRGASMRASTGHSQS